MEKKEKAPVLRFKDTNGKDYPAWEQRKLEDCATIIMGQSPKSENYTNDPKDHILVQGNADLKNGQVAPRVWTTEVTKIGKVGDIILSVRAPVGEVGKTAYDVVLGRGVAAIRGNDFLLQTLLKLKECKYWGKVSAGSTFDSITSEILKSTLISMPAIEEQIKIGDFLSSVDKLITLHQRKLEALKKLKRTLLQKMFPKKGHLKPELRFFGFTNDWEQRKLNEIASIYDGTHQTPRYTSNGIPFLSVENITTLQSSKFISEKDFLRDFPVYPKKGDVLLTRIGDVGTANVYERNQKVAFYVSLALLKLRETDPYFVNASFRSNSTRKEVWKRTLHIAFPKKINKNEIGKVNIQIPSLAEQRKIGIFFYSLDRLITLHQRE